MHANDNPRGASLMTLSMLGFALSDMGWQLLSPFMRLSKFLSIRGIFVMLGFGMLLLINKSKFPRSPRIWILILVRSFVEIGLAYAILTALRYVALADMTAILQTTPLAMTIAAYFVFGERFGWHRMLAILVGLLGVLIITRPGFGDTNLYYLLVVISVFLVVVRDMISRRLPKEVPSALVALTAAIVVTVVNAGASLTQVWSPLSLGLIGGVFLVSLAVMLGHFFVVSAMRVGEVNFVAAFRYTGILFAILIDAFVFQRPPDIWTLLGSILVAGAGVYTLNRERIARQERNAFPASRT